MHEDILHKMLVDQMQVYTVGLCPRLNPNFCGNKNIVNGKQITCGECFINYILEQVENSEENNE
ncbi:MAG: hypothetical protein WC389_13905 [Lutibacter sp.]